MPPSPSPYQIPRCRRSLARYLTRPGTTRLRVFTTTRRGNASGEVSGTTTATSMRRASPPQGFHDEDPSATATTRPTRTPAPKRRHSPPPFQLQQTEPFQVAITGGSSLMTQAIVEQIRSRFPSSSIAIFSRSRQRLVDLYGEVDAGSSDGVDAGAASGDNARTRGVIMGLEEFDMTDMASWDRIANKYSTVNTLINVAAHLSRTALVRQSSESLRTTVDANLLAPMLASRAFARVLMRRGKSCAAGHFVNISSLLALRGGRGAVAYAATKAGLVGLTRALTAELTPSRIRVNCVLPGWVDVGMGDPEELRTVFSEEGFDDLLAKIPLHRFATADEVAHAVIFLMENQYAAGTILNLDGGLSSVD